MFNRMFHDIYNEVLSLYFLTGMMNAETWINDIALFLAQDPAEVRGKNIIRKGQLTHYNHLIEVTSLSDCWNECLKQSRYYQVKKEVDDFNVANKWRKRGAAIIPTNFGIAFIARFLNQAGRCTVLKDPSVQQGNFFT